MTNQEAIRLIRNLPTMCEFTDAYGDQIDSDAYYEAVDMAISALQAQEVKNSKESSSTHKALDTISRQAAIDALRVAYWDDNIQSAKDDPCIVDAMTDWAIRQVKALPSAQPERLTDDDFETIRIHLSAFKERLCNQRRWEEAEEYQRMKVDADMREDQDGT